MADILNEIIQQSETVSSKNIFSSYRSKEEIGKRILDTLIQKKYNKKQSSKGFFIAENEKSKVGVFSHCLGLQSLSLANAFNVDILKASNGGDYLQIIKDTLLSIFSALNVTEVKVATILDGRPNEVSFNYDASPFVNNDDLDDESLKLSSYIDTMAKVLETFAEFRTFYGNLLDKDETIELDGVSNLANYVDAIIIKSMADLSDACIPLGTPVEYKINMTTVKDKFGEDCKYKGWNYVKVTEGSAQPSLYFTYSACSAYMSLYGSINYAINAARNLERNMSRVDIMNKVCPDFPEVTNNKKMARDFAFLKKAYSAYVDLNKRCVDAGHYFDHRINESGIDITQDFVGFDYQKVTTSELSNSTTNDALINTLFLTLIFVYSGIDLDYAAYGKGDDFNDRIQYAIQNILKVYNQMERANKSFIVNQYILSFNERLPEHLNEQVRLLRKQRILVASLMPLLIKSYTAISKYIIKYPQKQMRDYLRIILENRCYDHHTNSQIWLWDKEGYNISINLLYILNVLDFYSYYDTYEYPYTKDTDSFTYRLEQKEAEHAEKMDILTKEHKAEVERLQKELQETYAKIHQLKPIEKEVVNVSMDYLKDNVQEIIASALNKARTDTINDNVPNDLTRAFKGLFEAMFATEIRKQIDVGRIGQNQKLSENPTYLRYEKSMFDRFKDWLIDQMRSEEGLK